MWIWTPEFDQALAVSEGSVHSFISSYTTRDSLLFLLSFGCLRVQTLFSVFTSAIRSAQPFLAVNSSHGSISNPLRLCGTSILEAPISACARNVPNFICSILRV